MAILGRINFSTGQIEAVEANSEPILPKNSLSLKTRRVPAVAFMAATIAAKTFPEPNLSKKVHRLDDLLRK